jgi:alginate O-acetyltransferase complex protein AlgI
MAIGLGRMLGFEFLENFNFPYVSQSIREFWRRWHISLSNWFRDYLYISIGGNRLSSKRTYLNLFIVFFLTGLWHGASWNFVIWGLIHGVFIVIERLGFDKVIDRIKFVRNLYTLLIVLVAWVFFRLETLGEACSYIGKMFIGTDSDVKYHFTMFLSRDVIIVLLIALIMSFNGFNLFYNYTIKKLQLINSKGLIVVEYFKIIGLLLILCLSIMNVASGSYNPFIYFRF